MYKLMVYYRNPDQFLEPSNTWYLGGPITTHEGREATAEQLALGTANLQVSTVEHVRWEYFLSDGSKEDEGTMSISGEVGGGSLPFSYAMYVEKVSGGPENPSGLFVHGVPAAFISGNGLTPAGETQWASAKTIWLSVNVVDSDGAIVTDYHFAHWSRRSRIRRRTS